MVSKLTRALQKVGDARSRRTALRGYGQWMVGLLRFAWVRRPFRERVTFRSYAPDSVWVFDLHPETRALVGKWVRGNARNNAGDLGRFYAIVLNLKQVLKDEVPGDFAELGVYRGNSAAVLADFAARHGRHLLLFDTFAGFDERDYGKLDRPEEYRGRFGDTSVDAVRRTVGAGAPCTYVRGYFPESLTAECDRRYAFVHVDLDLYAPMKAALEYFYPRLSDGGCLFLHDYASGPWDGATRAIDEFCRQTGERPALLPDKSGTAVIRRRARPTGVSSAAVMRGPA